VSAENFRSLSRHPFMSHDVVVVGGGVAGTVLSRLLVREGIRVLVLERERSFRDRVRGEALLPWGVNEARDLGIYDLLRGTCGVEVRYWTSHARKGSPRDLVATTPRGAPCFTFYHPDLQEVLLGAAEAAGAEVRRGVAVERVESGPRPKVVFADGMKRDTVEAGLIVGADGRGSRVRTWAGFPVIRDPERMMIAGTLLGDVALPEESVHVFRRSKDGLGALLFPLGKGRVRTYFMYRNRGKRRGLSGSSRLPAFIDACRDVGVPGEWLDQVSAAGPLAEFDAADSWVEHPYKDGVALIGDAASSNDPTWGNGVSLAFRDARALAEALRRHGDWDRAGHAYAEAHGAYFGAVNRLTRWLTELNYEVGPDADARRDRALPLFAQDPTRVPDYISLGPDSPASESTRQRLFGEV